MVTKPEFFFDQFLWSTFILVLLPTAIALSSICARESRHHRSNLKSIFFVGFFIGFLTAALWLSWSPSTPISRVFTYGAPVDFSAWQVMGCGITLIVLNALFLSRAVRTPYSPLSFSVCTAAGFATAFSLGVSFGVSTQEGVGILLSYVGVGILLLITNSISRMVLSWIQ
ncbi:hypothetical protein [Corynebacterium ulcerans]|uniref:hypothetical protein n=1 Tax=Corynebacterium ulcerans TaxID=65058 RepID=UPI0011AF20D6|nr:hypothetical protein [Corynebacterium ulcerans]